MIQILPSPSSRTVMVYLILVVVGLLRLGGMAYLTSGARGDWGTVALYLVIYLALAFYGLICISLAVSRLRLLSPGDQRQVKTLIWFLLGLYLFMMGYAYVSSGGQIDHSLSLGLIAPIGILFFYVITPILSTGWVSLLIILAALPFTVTRHWRIAIAILTAMAIMVGSVWLLPSRIASAPDLAQAGFGYPLAFVIQDQQPGSACAAAPYRTRAIAAACNPPQTFPAWVKYNSQSDQRLFFGSSSGITQYTYVDYGYYLVSVAVWVGLGLLVLKVRAKA